MKNVILAAAILATALFGRVQPAQAGGLGVGVAIGAAAGLLTGAAIATAACNTPRCYYAPVTYVPAYAPAPVAYAPAVYAPAPPPVAVYQPPVVIVRAPVVSTAVRFGGPYYRLAHRPRVVIRARW